MGIRYSRLGETLTSTEAFFGWMPIRAMPLSWRPIHRADGSTRPLGRRIERVSTSSGACLAGGKWPSFQRDPAAGAEKDLVRRFHLGNLVPNNISPDGRYIFTASADSSTNTRFMLLIPLDGGAPRVIMPVAAETKPEDLKNYDKGQAVGGVIGCRTAAPSSSQNVPRAKKRGKCGRFRSTEARRTSWIRR